MLAFRKPAVSETQAVTTRCRRGRIRIDPHAAARAKWPMSEKSIDFSQNAFDVATGGDARAGNAAGGCGCWPSGSRAGSRLGLSQSPSSHTIFHGSIVYVEYQQYGL